jgi:CRISPR/Cas system CSM-associated protein Csm3 (group 7 of RAMP superfamily)
MARNLHSRWIISGTMITTSPISVGGIVSDASVDLALAIDGQGNYYVPGTSLAGALRSWISRNYDNENNQASQISDRLFGYQPAKDEQGGHASFVTISDISISQTNLFFEIRDGVGIDRETGTATDRFKYNRAVLPKGTNLPLEISIERDKELKDEDWQIYQTAIAHLLDAFKTGKIPIGAAKTRGLGRIKLNETDWDIQTHDYQTRKGILAALGYQSNGAKPEDAAQPFAYTASANSSQSTNLAVAISWHPVEPVMVKAEGEGIAVDILPLTSANGKSVTFVLPGSSIKGSLRTQAERIVRTVLEIGIVNQSKPYLKQNFPTQIDVPLIRELFGKAAKIENGDQQGRIGALSVIDCYANLNITPQAWANIESATTEPNKSTDQERKPSLRDYLDTAGLSQTTQAMHVAIDRWTGGAADQMLYSTLEPIGFDWEPIVLELDLSSKSIPKYVAIALVLLVLRDMMLSKIPLGYATNRGMGAIAVDRIKITGNGLTPELAALADVTIENSNLNNLSPELLNALTTSWKEWIDSQTNHQTEVQGVTAS